MEPATSIIHLFDEPAAPTGGRGRSGVSIICEICDVRRATVYRWMTVVVRGGTHGRIPQRYHNAILAEAQKRGLPLEQQHFWPDQKPQFSISQEAAE